MDPVTISKPEPSSSPVKMAEALEAPVRGRLQRAGMIVVAASLVAILQAWLAADTLAALATGSTPFASAGLAGILYFALGTIRHGMDAAGGRVAFHAAQDVIGRERGLFVETEARTSPMDHGRPSSAAGAALLAEKLDLLGPYLSRYRLASMKVAIVPLVIVAVTAFYSWAAALVLLVAGPLIPLFMALIGMAAQEASERQMAETGALNGLLLERINALADIRLLNAADAVTENFFEAADRLRAKTMAVLRIAFLSSTVLELFAAIGIAMVAVYVGFSLLGVLSFGSYGTPLPLAAGVFILLLAPDYFAPLRELAAAWHDRAAALAVAGELATWRARPALKILGEDNDPLALNPKSDIATRDLVVRPAGGDPISYPDVTIAPGESVAITGPSGVGKSTFLALITGLIPPDGGEIRVGGRCLDDETVDSWRRNLAWVGQNPHFLNASLRTNIALGGDRDDEKLAAALAAAAAEGIVAALPRGADTRLGETGAGVSGGEARRLMIARAFHSNASVVLADEPTADLDPDTAERITESLMALSAGGVTLVVATHDHALAARLNRTIDLGAQP
jgi:ATP-binding cassette subfamily C protein CydD